MEMNKTGIQCKTLLQLLLILREPDGAIFLQDQIWPILVVPTVTALFVDAQRAIDVSSC